MKILLALGSDPVAPFVAGAFGRAGWTVVSDPGGEDAVQFAEIGGIDVALIAADRPDAHRLAERLRTAAPDVALMAIGTDPSLALKGRLFDAGADDVLAHPVAAEEVAMRARAIVRRRHGHRERVIRFGDLAVMPGEHATVRGRPLPLTRGEFALLDFLALRAGRSVSHGQLLAALYDGPDEPEPNAVAVRVCRLRNKLASYGVPLALIGTVWGAGWIIAEPYGAGAAMPPHRADVKGTLRDRAAAEADAAAA